MRESQIKPLLSGLEPKLLTWLACDVVQFVDSHLKFIGAPVCPEVAGYIQYTRCWLYDPTSTNLAEKVTSFDNIVDIKNMWKLTGNTQLRKLSRATLHLMTPGEETAAIQSVASMLTSKWIKDQIKYLKEVQELCGHRSIQLLYEGKCPIYMTDPPTPKRQLYLIEPGDIQEANWNRILYWLAKMWIGVALIRLLSAFI